MSVIKEGDKVIIRRDTFLRSENVCCGRKVAIHKWQFVLDDAIGCPYGTTFTVNNLRLSVKPPCNDSNVTSQSQLNTTSGENNQLIHDDGNSQKMSKDNIMALKAAGVAGENIVGLLIENSDSFDKKTEFSQEKYVKKKKKRHLSEITILKPTLPLICEMLYANSPGKILDLRMDTVSQILTMANIQSNTNVMLMESTQSFLAGVILHRMGGLGNVVQIYSGDFPVRLCLGHFDLEKKDMAILNGFTITKINAIEKLGLESEDSSKPVAEITEQSDETPTVSNCEQMELNEDDKEEESEQSQTDEKETSDDKEKQETSDDKETQETSDDKETQETSDDKEKQETSDDNEKQETSEDKEKQETSDDKETQETSDDKETQETSDDKEKQETSDDKETQETNRNVLTSEEKATRKKKRDDEEQKALTLLKKRSMDSLIIATKVRAKTTVLKLIEFLAPSRPLVVYSTFKEILVECYIALKELENTVLLNLTETWWRNYQVLPSRTHPQIMMDGSGGYLLTAIKVANNGPSPDDDGDDSTRPTPVKKMKMEDVSTKTSEQPPNEAD